MSVQTVAGKFMELCNQGKHFDFMRAFYAPDMVSVEGDGREFVGKEPVIKKSEVFQGANAIDAQDLHGAFFCGDPNSKSGQFAVYQAYTFTPKKGGPSLKHDEVGLYTVKNDMITREEFFYDDAFLL